VAVSVRAGGGEREKDLLVCLPDGLELLQQQQARTALVAWQISSWQVFGSDALYGALVVAALEEGLAQKTAEKGDDGGLTASLQQALGVAQAAKVEQDEAREQAWAHCRDGELLMAGDLGADSLERALAQFHAGLALKTATNGEHGWESCMAKLEAQAGAAAEAKLAEDRAREVANGQKADGQAKLAEAATATAAARAAGDDHATAATQHAASVQALKAAVGAFGAALEQETHLPELTAELTTLRQKALCDVAQATANHHASEGREKLAAGADATSQGSASAEPDPAQRAKHHWRSAQAFMSAISAFEAGLVQEDDLDEEMVEQLESSRQDAVRRNCRCTQLINTPN
jgi:hypothetical protein